MPNPNDTIKLDGSNNFVVLDADHAELHIDTADADDAQRKLGQLSPPQLALLLQIAKEHQGRLPGPFLSLLQGMAVQKNVVHGSIQAQAVRIGDELHYHLHLEAKAVLPKKLSLEIPTIAPDAVVGRDRELRDLRQLLLNPYKTVKQIKFNK